MYACIRESGHGFFEGVCTQAIHLSIPATQESRVPLSGRRGGKAHEVDVRVHDDPVRFTIGPRDVSVQAHRNHVATPSHRSLSFLTAKPPGVYIKPRTSENVTAEFGVALRRTRVIT